MQLCDRSEPPLEDAFLDLSWTLLDPGPGNAPLVNDLDDSSADQGREEALQRPRELCRQ